jgi:predicted amidophosphoribosyltransferase
MRCLNCNAQNRPNIKFCEKCGKPLEVMTTAQAGVCASCGYKNQPGMRFCENCGERLVAERSQIEEGPSVEAVVSGIEGVVGKAEPLTCSTCGNNNWPGMRFCERCGEPLVIERVQTEEAPPPVDLVQVKETAASEVEGRVCPTCGCSNRTEYRFCERCGEPLVIIKAPAKPRQPLGKSLGRRVLVYGGIAAAFLIVAAVFMIRSNQNEVINDFSAVMQQVESEAVQSAQGYVDDWAPWADQESPHVRRLETETGFAYMVTFDQNPAEKTENSSDFDPRFVVIVDPLTGETGFALAP